MEAARKTIQIMRFVFAGTVVIYLFVIFRLPSAATPNPIIHRALTVLCVTLAIVIFPYEKFCYCLLRIPFKETRKTRGPCPMDSGPYCHLRD